MNGWDDGFDVGFDVGVRAERDDVLSILVELCAYHLRVAEGYRQGDEDAAAIHGREMAAAACNEARQIILQNLHREDDQIFNLIRRATGQPA